MAAIRIRHTAAGVVTAPAAYAHLEAAIGVALARQAQPPGVGIERPIAVAGTGPVQDAVTADVLLARGLAVVLVVEVAVVAFLDADREAPAVQVRGAQVGGGAALAVRAAGERDAVTVRRALQVRIGAAVGCR